MREIKFRQWRENTFERYMDYEPTLFVGTGLSAFINEAIKESESPLMQYTGLQDKHGKEIYEGDVLASVSAMQKETGYVVFDNGAFCLVILSSRTTKTDSKYFLSTCKELEIIGNIYENPELLEAD